ncbi:MAG: hypothetical protein LC753_06125 [Acidobacteria bacterium]|nr:hypothetical protein [Acidobacteriota bacterium]MCA1649865.1 hypothetical protein [Acidobacteriota bacterium]
MSAPSDTASYWWEQAFRNAAGGSAEPLRASIARGVQAADRALTAQPDDPQAILYKSLLLRMLAGVESEPAAQTRLVHEADSLHARAALLNKKKTAGL